MIWDHLRPSKTKIPKPNCKVSYILYYILTTFWLNFDYILTKLGLLSLQNEAEIVRLFFQQMPSNFASNQRKRIFTVSVPFSERQVAPTEVLCYHLQAVRYLLVTRKYLEEAPVKIQIQRPVKTKDLSYFSFLTTISFRFKGRQLYIRFCDEIDSWFFRAADGKLAMQNVNRCRLFDKDANFRGRRCKLN